MTFPGVAYSSFIKILLDRVLPRIWAPPLSHLDIKPVMCFRLFAGSVSHFDLPYNLSRPQAIQFAFRAFYAVNRNDRTLALCSQYLRVSCFLTSTIHTPPARSLLKVAVTAFRVPGARANVSAFALYNRFRGPYNPRRPRVRKCAEPAAPLYFRSVRCDELMFPPSACFTHLQHFL